METTKLSTKGQVILPKAIREAHRWEAGTEFAVEEASGGIVLRPVKVSTGLRVEDVAGCLRYSGRAKSLKQMDNAILQELKERRARGRY